ITDTPTRCRVPCAGRCDPAADGARPRKRGTDREPACGALRHVAGGRLQAHQGARERRSDPPRGARAHACVPSRARTAGQRASVAPLLRALLDRPPDRAGPPAAPGERTPILHSEKRKTQMSKPKIPDAYGTLIEPTT